MALAQQQLLLGLDLPPTFESTDFVVGSCNADAYTWIMRWPDWPTRVFAIYGPPGCGKSHLATIWQQRSHALVVSGTNLPSLNMAPPKAVVIDGSPVDMVAYLHLYNYVIEHKGYLLLTDHQPPARWEIPLPDLRSRLLAVPSLEITSPDDTVLAAVLIKLFADQQIKIKTDCIDYILPRIERSFNAVQTLVNQVGRYSLETQKSVTISSIRHILENFS